MNICRNKETKKCFYKHKRKLSDPNSVNVLTCYFKKMFLKLVVNLSNFENISYRKLVNSNLDLNT